jgi:hypothetical protein
LFSACATPPHPVTLNWKDFGLTWNPALETGGFLVSDNVRVNLSIQAGAQ